MNPRMFLRSIMAMILSLMTIGVVTADAAASDATLRGAEDRILAPTAGPLVRIEIGHWGAGDGAKCFAWERSEFQVAYAVGQKVAANLRGRGYTVEVISANPPKSYGVLAKAYVAIHADSCNPFKNGFKVARWGGTAANYGYNGSCDGADNLVGRLKGAYKSSTSLPENRDYSSQDLLKYFGLSQNNRQDAAIIELGYMWSDYNFLTSSSGQDKMAAGIANGVQQFLTGARMCFRP